MSKLLSRVKLIALAKYYIYTRIRFLLFRENISMFRECVIDSQINYIQGTELMCHSACNGVSIQ